MTVGLDAVDDREEGIQAKEMGGVERAGDRKGVLKEEEQEILKRQPPHPLPDGYSQCTKR